MQTHTQKKEKKNRINTTFGVTPDCRHHQTEDDQLAYPQMNQVLRYVLQEKNTDRQTELKNGDHYSCHSEL